MNRRLRRNHFFLKPFNTESDKLLVELIGRHRTSFDGQTDQKFLKGFFHGGYKVTPDELVLVFKYSQADSGLKCEFLVRFCGDNDREPKIIPNQYLRSVRSLARWIKYKCAEVTYCVAPKQKDEPPEPGVFPMNALQRTEAQA